MSFALALLIASAFWTGNGVGAGNCPHPFVDQLSTPIEGYAVPTGYQVEAVADITTCTISVSSYADATYWARCQTIVHEVGHLRGLEHSTGIMDANPIGYIPEACDHPRQFRRWWHRNHLTSAEDMVTVRGWRRWARLNFYP